MLADPRLTTMLRDLAALQVLATGLRSVHRDPREEAGRTTGGRKAPEVTELDRAADSGDLARARAASRVFARTPPALHATLAWLADRAHGGDGDWPRYLAAALAPAGMRDRVTRSTLAHDLATAQRAALKAALAKGSRRVTAETLRDAAKVHAACAKAETDVNNAGVERSRAEAALRRWGETRLAACVAAWHAARDEAGREAAA